jgi:hypothetical protein
MKCAVGSVLLAGIVALGVSVVASGGALAQAEPDANSGGNAGSPAPRAQPLERAPMPQRPDAQTPSEDGPAAQEEAPAIPGCQDRGRKLELIV